LEIANFSRFSELLNKVWGLEGCLPNFYPLRKNRCSKLNSALEPRYWLVVEISRPVTRRLNIASLDNLKYHCHIFLLKLNYGREIRH
jgi:hypothetical protein